MQIEEETKVPNLGKQESKYSEYTDGNGGYDDDDEDDGYYSEDPCDDEDEDDIPTLKNQRSLVNLQILKDEQIVEQLKKIVEKDIQNTVYLDFDKSLIIFKHYNFSVEQVNMSYFNNPDEIKKQYGLDMGSFEETTEDIDCDICFDSGIGIKLPCGNTYCFSCVGQHIESKVSNKVVFFKCMEDGCNYNFQHTLVMRVLEQNKLQNVKKLYITNLSRVYAEVNKAIKWCPGIDCEYCVQDESFQSQNVECPNGHKFCFKCRMMDWHKPCPCNMVEDWNKKNGQSTLDDKWIEANTKKCPHCSRAIQRSLGCDFMRCAPPGGCGKAFCYVCDKQISESEHMAHASCKLGNKNSSQEKAKDYLKKVEFYVDRVKTCAAVKQRAREVLDKELEDKREILFKKNRINLNESEFLQKAFKILIDSRDALKYSYIFSFQQFVLKEDKRQENNQALFENYQKIFEEHCEKLARQLDMEFGDFILKISEFEDFSEANGIQNPDTIHEFHSLKQKINAQAEAISKNSDTMIESVETGQIFN